MVVVVASDSELAPESTTSDMSKKKRRRRTRSGANLRRGNLDMPEFSLSSKRFANFDEDEFKVVDGVVTWKDNLFLSPTIDDTDRNGYFEPLGRPIRVACAGDSLTRGVSGGNRLAHSYPSQLRGMLGGNFEVHNFGRNAVTAMRGMSISYIDKQEFRNSLNVQPDIYLLMLGTNDSRYWFSDAYRFPEGLRWIVNQVKSLASSPRIILAIPPWVKNDIYGIRNDIVSNNVRAEIERVAREFNLQVVDMHDVTVNKGDYFARDGLHLNQQGYAKLATSWKEAFECNRNGICEIGESCSSCPGDCYVNCS